MSDPKTFTGTIWLVFNGSGWDVWSRQGENFSLAPPSKYLHWGLDNTNNLDLKWVRLNYGEVNAQYHGSSQGPLKNGVLMSDIPAWYPIPKTVDIEWEDSKSQRHEQMLDVASQMSDPTHFKGTIWLIYDGTNWHVQPKAK